MHVLYEDIGLVLSGEGKWDRSMVRSLAQVLIEADGSLLAWGAQTAWQPPCFQQAASSAEGTWAAVREIGDVMTWGEPNHCDIRLAPLPRWCCFFQWNGWQVLSAGLGGIYIKVIRSYEEVSILSRDH